MFNIRIGIDRDWDRALDRARARALDRDWNWDRDRDRDRGFYKALDQVLNSAALPDEIVSLRQHLWSEPAISEAVAEYLTGVSGLQPDALWREALKAACLPQLPGHASLMEMDHWRSTRDAFAQGSAGEQEIQDAAAQLFLDGALNILGFHNPDDSWLRENLGYDDETLAGHLRIAAETQPLLAEIAELTRNRNEAPLRIAHCIRDLAYGDESRTDDLKAMVQSDDPAYREIFVRSYWLPTPEEREREMREEEEARKKRRPKR